MSEAVDRFIYTYIVFIMILVLFIGSGGSSWFAGSNIGDFEIPVPTPPSDNIVLNLLSSGWWFISNLGFFFYVMTLTAETTWITLLIFSPAIVMLLIKGLHLVRGN